MKKIGFPWGLLIFSFCQYLLIALIIGSTSIKGIPLAGAMVITLVIALMIALASALTFQPMLIVAYVLTIAWMATVIIAGNWILTLEQLFTRLPELLPLVLILPVAIVAPVQEAGEKLLFTFNQSQTWLILARTIVSGLSMGWLLFALKFCLNGKG
jgi:hypothetical protein